MSSQEVHIITTALSDCRAKIEEGMEKWDTVPAADHYVLYNCEGSVKRSLTDGLDAANRIWMNMANVLTNTACFLQITENRYTEADDAAAQAIQSK